MKNVVLKPVAHFMFQDHESNPEQFPSGSLYGMGNGIWWAFVTMTTVG